MISSLDFLYITLSFAAIVVTVLLILVAVHVLQVLRDVARISSTLEAMSELIGRIAAVVLPGIERSAKRIDGMEKKVANFVEQKLDEVLDR